MEERPAEEGLYPLSEGEIAEVYDYLRRYGYKTFPSEAKFLEVLDGYWNEVLRRELGAVRLRRGTIAGRTTFEVLRDAIVTKWIRGRCHPGSSAGGLAADALGQPVMQATLKTFHFAGLKKAGFGSTTAAELVSLSTDRQSPNARVHLRRDMGFSEAYAYFLAHRLIRVKDLVVDQAYDILVNDPSQQPYLWPPWYYAAIGGRAERPPQDWGACLKLNLDPVALHQYRLAPAAVARIIEGALNGGRRELFCVGSPLRDYAVYVLAYHEVVLRNESQIMEVLLRGGAEEEEETSAVEAAPGGAAAAPRPALQQDRILLEQAFFGHLALARILNVDIPGDRYLAAGVLEAGVQSTSVLSVVLREEALGLHRGRGLYRWHVNKLARREGITLYRLGRLLQAAGYAVRAVAEFPVVGPLGPAPERPLRAPPDPEDDSWLEGEIGGQPTWLYHLRALQDSRRCASLEVLAPPGLGGEGAYEHLKRLVAEDGKILEAADKRNERLGVFPFVHSRVGNSGLLTQLSAHWHFGTSQPNVLDLLRHPDVDPRFTITNQLRQSKTKIPGIAETLGIMALRNWIFEEFYETIVGGGDYIDPQHVVLVADYMVHLGRPTPLTSGGFATRETATNDEAYFDKAAARYVATASVGKEEDVSTIASAIALGQPMPQGTGLVRPGLLEVAPLPDAVPVGGVTPRRSYQRLSFTLDRHEASAQTRQERWKALSAFNAAHRRAATAATATATTATAATATTATTASPAVPPPVPPPVTPPVPPPVPQPVPAPPLRAEQMPPAAPIRSFNRRTQQALLDLLDFAPKGS